MTETKCLHAALCQECSEVHALLDEDIAGLRAQLAQAAHKLDRWRSVARRWWDRLVASESNIDAATLRAEQAEAQLAQAVAEGADWERRAIDEQGAAELTRQELAQAVAEGACYRRELDRIDELIDLMTSDRDTLDAINTITKAVLASPAAPLAAEHLRQDAERERQSQCAIHNRRALHCFYCISGLLAIAREASKHIPDATFAADAHVLIEALAPPQARGAEGQDASDDT